MSGEGWMGRIGLGTHSTLRDNIVGIALAEACAFEQIHDIRFACALLVETVFVLLETDGASENDFVSTCGETVV